MPALLMFLLFIAIIGAVTAIGWHLLSRRAQALGLDSVGDYLAQVPRTEAEIEDAIDLTVKGLVLAVLGVAIGPLILIAPVPLFYGVRKLLRSRLLPTEATETAEQ